jgi:hypothetical protein
MSEFPTFTNLEPLIIPAKEEKVYDKLWLHRMIIEAPNPQVKSTVYMEFTPYDGKGLMQEAPLTYNTIPDAFGLAGKDPLFAQTMGMVFMMLNKYKDIDFSSDFNVWTDGTVHQPPEEEFSVTPIEPIEPITEIEE